MAPRNGCDFGVAVQASGDIVQDCGPPGRTLEAWAFALSVHCPGIVVVDEDILLTCLRSSFRLTWIH